jgi:proteasome lid subunit RPN8/RPN11
MLFIEEAAGMDMMDDAIATFPDECCGFMFGNEADDNRYITEIKVVKNAKEGNKHNRYEISATDYLEAERYSLVKNLSILGVYHSHPNHPPIASETDRLAAQPYFSYLIISVVNRKFSEWRSWRLNPENRFEEELINKIENTEKSKSKQSWQQ